MHKLGYLAAVALVALGLTACSAATDAGAAQKPASAAQETAEVVEPTAAPATVAPAEPAEPTDSEIDAWFLEHSAIRVLDLTDDQKLSAGKFACEQVGAGNPAVVAVEGVDHATNRAVVLDAVTILCPDLEPRFRDYMESQPL